MMSAIEHTERGSFLYRLDSRTKLMLVLFFTLIVFIVDQPFVAAALMLSFLGLLFAAKLPFKKITAYIKLLSALMVFVVVLQMLFGPGERYMLKPLIPESVPLVGGRGALKWDGLILGVVIVCRLTSLMLLLPMLTMTTTPRQLAMGLTRLGMPYKAAYIATTALNLIPAFEEDARIIMDAQKLRGMRAFEEGTLMDKFRAYPALAIPLLTGAMRRAQLLGIAMDARGFGAFKTKSWLESIRMTSADYRAFAAALVFAAAALILNWAL